MEPQPGISAFGPYRVVREVGRGGMGAVYEVTHPELPRRLALKLILETQADEDALMRFDREARLLAQVRHRNVLVVHAFGRSARGPYLVTDLVEGESLRQRLFDGPLEPREAARIVRDLADAMAAVHAQGILHRDIKPDNVLLQPDGTPVLLDFGLARELDAQRLTLSGQVVGTPAYMAPEQAAGTTDERSDVYGMGALLFALLAGRAPFEGTNHVRVLTMVMTEEPRWPSEDRPLIPQELEAVCRVAMSKEPQQRYASARDLRDDLDRWLRDEPTWAGERVPVVLLARARARRRRLLLTVGLPAAILVTASAAALALRASGPGPRPDAPQVVRGLQLELSAPPAVLGSTVMIRCRILGEGAGPVEVQLAGDDRSVTTTHVGATVELWARLDAGRTRDVGVLARGGGAPVRDAVTVRRWGPRPDGLAWPAPPSGVRLAPADGEYLNDKDGSVLVFVPPGTFSMGYRTVLSKEFAPPNVTFTRGYLIGKTEVTRAQWTRFCEATGRAPMAWSEPRDDLPATHLDRDDAREYCRWAGLRLPSGAEWEFAARGVEGRVHPWGSRAEDGPRSPLGGRPGALLIDGTRDVTPWGEGPVPCGSLPQDRSPVGCLDMGGNVHEWADDEFYPAPGQLHEDPVGDRDEHPRARGGSFKVPLAAWRTTARLAAPFDVGSVGFRVARDLRE